MKEETSTDSPRAVLMSNKHAAFEIRQYEPMIISIQYYHRPLASFLLALEFLQALTLVGCSSFDQTLV